MAAILSIIDGMLLMWYAVLIALCIAIIIRFVEKKYGRGTGKVFDMKKWRRKDG